MIRGTLLDLFPGAGLLGRAFEESGFTVVRGPDLITGGDVRDFHARPGVFDGVIGGPPCQTHSSASEIVGTDAVDLVPEFVRIVDEAQPDFVTMENVAGVTGHADIPRSWHPAKLRDWDCGGLTKRVRYFWTWPFMVLEPARRPGDPSPSLMASTYKRGSGQYCEDKGFLRGDLDVEEYARLQGAEDVLESLQGSGAPYNRATYIHLLGNGVPRALGRWVAQHASEWIDQREAS